MKTSKINIRLILLQCVGFILTGCTIYGYAPIGLGYFGAMYATGRYRLLTLLTTTLGLSCNLDYIDSTKYIMGMLLIAGIISLYETYRKENITTYVTGGIVTLAVGLMEFTDVLLSFDNRIDTYIVAAGVCVLAGAIMVVFARGIDGMLNIDQEKEMQSEEMIGVSVICGICFYYLVTSINVPYSIVESITFLLMLYFPYKYGAGIGAIAGAGFGIAMGLKTNQVEIVSIMCIAAIAIGGMRELGRVASAVAMMCTVVSGSLIFAPDTLDETSVKGMIAGAIIFLILPRRFIYIDKIENKENISVEVDNPKLSALKSTINILYEALQKELVVADDEDKKSRIKKIVGEVCTECAKCGKCRDKGIVTKAFVDKGRADMSEKRNCPYIYKMENEVRFMEERCRADDIWKNRVNHLRENINLQLEEITSLLDSYSENGLNERSEKSDKLYGKLYRKCRNRFITLLEFHVRENESGIDTIDMTVKCDEGKVVTIREIAGILSEVTGVKMESDNNEGVVVGDSYKTLFFRQAEHFSLSCGVAKSVKKDGDISGDNQQITDIGNGKWLITLADGMGSGEEAFKGSENVIEMLTGMLKKGFGKESAIRLVNSISSMDWKNEQTTSVDMGIVDMYSGVCNILKMGGASTFIKREGWVDVMKSTSLPVGIVDKADIDSVTKKLYSGDKIVLVSDGVLEGIDSDNAELEISRILLENDYDSPTELASRILEKAMEDSYYLPNDDMTVIVAAIDENLKSA